MKDPNNWGEFELIIFVLCSQKNICDEDLRYELVISNDI